MLDLSKTTSPAATPDFEAIKQRQPLGRAACEHIRRMRNEGDDVRAAKGRKSQRRLRA